MLKMVFYLVTGGASEFWPAGRVEQGTAGIFINKKCSPFELCAGLVSLFF